MRGVLAVDTNVVVRFLTGDEPAQAGRARALFEHEAVLLLKTVLLETEWVLRRLYQFDSKRIADAFRALIALPLVECEDLNAVARRSAGRSMVWISLMRCISLQQFRPKDLLHSMRRF